MSDASRTFVDGPGVALRRAVVASLLGVCLHGGGWERRRPAARIPARERRPRCDGGGGPRQGQWAEAEGLLRPLQASHADCGGVALGLARLRAARGDPAEAERLFDRATSLAPDDALAHALFAQYWLSRGQRARADYQSALALSLDPDCPEALVVRDRSLSLKGQAARRPAGAGEGRAIWTRRNAEAHYQLGICSLPPAASRGGRPAVREGGGAAPDATPAPTTTWPSASKRWAKPSTRRCLPERAAGERRRSLLRLPSSTTTTGASSSSRGAWKRAGRTSTARSSFFPGRRGVRYERGKLNLALRQYRGRPRGRRARPRSPGPRRPRPRSPGVLPARHRLRASRRDGAGAEVRRAVPHDADPRPGLETSTERRVPSPGLQRPLALRGERRLDGRYASELEADADPEPPALGDVRHLAVPLGR